MMLAAVDFHRNGDARRVSVNKVLVLLPSLQFGGAERQSLDLCDGFAATGARVAVLSTESCLASAVFSGRDYRLLPRRIEWDDSSSFEDNVGRQRGFVQEALALWRPDFAVICLPWPHYGFGLHLGLWAGGTPHLMVSHLFPHARLPEQTIWPNMMGLGASTEEGAAFAWAGVSWPIARRLERLFQLPANSVVTVANGVSTPALSPDQRQYRRTDARERLGLDEDRKIVLSLGRLDHAKGVDLLPAIAREIADLSPTFVCAGQGALRTMLEGAPEVAQGLIRLVGQVDDPSDWLFAADALLLPSRIEGHPLVFLEAAAHRCPVVTTDVALECYGDEAGRFARVAPMDDTPALAGALREALGDPACNAPRVEGAYRLARRRDKAAMIGDYLSLCRSITARDRVLARRRDTASESV